MWKQFHKEFNLKLITPSFRVPELLVLNDCNIDRAGDSEDLQKKCSTVRELDLAQNKLERWEEVFRIMAQMPRLEFVNLSANRLYGPIEAPPCDIQMAQLRSLVLNNTRLEWDSVDTLLNLLPALEELHLSLNDYKNVLIDTHVEDDVTVLAEELLEGTETEGTDEESENHLDNACECHAEKPKSCKRSKTGFGGRGEWIGSYLGVFAGESTCSQYKKSNGHDGVRKLHFTGNPVTDWVEICRLGRVFPSLESLVLADCPIRSLDAPPLSPTASTSTDVNANEPSEEETAVSHANFQ